MISPTIEFIKISNSWRIEANGDEFAHFSIMCLILTQPEAKLD